MSRLNILNKIKKCTKFRYIISFILVITIVLGCNILAFASSNRSKDITGEISWVGDLEDNRPASVVVDLFQNGTKYKTQEVKAEDNWQYTFSNVPVSDNNGNIYEYSISENKVDGYLARYATGKKNGIELKFNEQTGSVNKVYGSVTIYYELDGKTYSLGTFEAKEVAGKTFEIPSNNFYLYWKGYFNLLKYYGMSIDYIVEKDVDNNIEAVESELPECEITTLEGSEYPETEHPYTSYKSYLWHYKGLGGSGYDIININNSYEYSGKINWVGDTVNLRPEKIRVSLLNNNNEIKELDINTLENNKYTFNNVPIYKDDSMDKISYYIKADVSDEYITVYDESDITNIYKYATINIDTHWGAKVAEYERNLSEIKYSLIQRVYEYDLDGKLTGNYTNEIVQEVLATKSNNWKATFENVLRCNEFGEYYQYFIDINSDENIDLQGKNIELPDNSNELNITAVVVHAGRDINGSKAWNGDAESDRPESITLTLYQNGEAYKTITTSANEDWRYNFGSVPETDEYGNKYTYYIKETPVDNYKSTYSADGNAVEITFSNQLSGTGINSGLAVYSKVDETEHCVAVFNSLDEAAGQSVIVPSTEFYVVTTAIIEVPFTYEFITISDNEVINNINIDYNANLESAVIKKLDGAVGNYMPVGEVSENFSNVHGYEVTTSSVTPSAGLMAVLNVRLSTFDITVNWVGDTEQDRPDKLDFSIFDSEGYNILYDPFSLDADNNWTGTAYCYYTPSSDIVITETHLDGYTYSISGDADNGYVIIYTKNNPTYSYVDGINGKDNNDGLTADTAVKTFKQAYANMSDGGTIYVVDTVEVNNDITLGKNYYKDDTGTINVKGNVIIKRYSQPNNVPNFTKTSNLQYLIKISDIGKLTIDELVIDGHMNSNTSENNFETADGIKAESSLINNKGTLTVSNSTLQNNYLYVDNEENYYSAKGGAIYSEKSAKLDVSNSKFYDNIAEAQSNIEKEASYSYGGAICAAGTITITNTEFKNNISKAVALETSDNKATAYGGAVFVEGQSTIDNCKFDNNKAECTANKTTALGGALCNNMNLTSGNNIFINNSAQSGGAIVNTSTMISNNDTFKNNKATQGGAVTNFNSLVLNNALATDNNADTFAGAVANACCTMTYIGGGISGSYSDTKTYKLDGTIRINGGTFSKNTAIQGGAIALSSEKDTYIKDCIIENNTAELGGGIIDTEKGTLTIDNATFKANEAYNENTSKGHGGAIFKDEGLLNVTGTEFTENKAYNYGGAIYSNQAVNIVDSEFNNNESVDLTKYMFGSAIYSDDGESVIANCGFNSNKSHTAIVYLAHGEIKNSIFSNNEVISSTVFADIINSCTFDSNKATNSGSITNANRLVKIIDVEAYNNDGTLIMLANNNGEHIIDGLIAHENNKTKGSVTSFGNNCEVKITNSEFCNNYGTSIIGMYSKITLQNDNIHNNSNIGIESNGSTLKVKDTIIKNNNGVYDTKLFGSSVLNIEGNSASGETYLSLNADIYVVNELTYDSVVANLHPVIYAYGADVVHVNYDNKKASDIIDKFTLQPINKKSFMLRPGDYVVDALNIKDTDIIISGALKLDYDENIKYEVTGLPASQTCIWGEEFKISQSIPSTDSFNFLGWSMSRYNPDSYIKSGQNYYITNSTKLYAQWEVKMQKFKFDVNGGRVSADGLTVKNDLIYSGNSLYIEEISHTDSINKLSSDEELQLTNGNRTFIGWTVEKYDKYEHGIEYITKLDTTTCMKYFSDKLGDEPITLYALWELRNYAYVDGVNGDDNNTGLTADESIRTLAQAYKNLKSTGGTIYIVDTVVLSHMEEMTGTYFKSRIDGNEFEIINLDPGCEVNIKRYSQPLSELLTTPVAYRLSGVWKLNSELEVEQSITQNINFKSDSEVGTSMKLLYDSYSLPSGTKVTTIDLGYDLGYKNAYGGAVMAAAYSRGSGISEGWINEQYRTIDFGSTPQEVSEEFYRWFTANAVQN